MNGQKEAIKSVEDFLKSDSKCMLITGTDQFKKHLLVKEHKPMKKLITSLLALVLVLSLAACGSGDNTDSRINVPKSSTDLEGEDYKDVMTLLQVAGFTNIEVELLDDLITGWLTKDGEVENVKSHITI